MLYRRRTLQEQASARDAAHRAAWVAGRHGVRFNPGRRAPPSRCRTTHESGSCRGAEVPRQALCGPFGFSCAHKKSPEHKVLGAFSKRCLTITYSRMGRPHTTIGALRFHFRVRQGIGWFTQAMVVRRNFQCILADCLVIVSFLRIRCSVERRCHYRTRPLGCYRVKPHGPLVHVSSTPCSASTPCLSTSWSRWALQEARGLGDVSS